jgi:hypothetical protein
VTWGSDTFGKKLLNLMGITSVEDTDYLVIQKNTAGDQFTRKMLHSDYVAAVLEDVAKIYNVERFSSTGSINSATDLALSNGTFTLNMPSTATTPITIKSTSGTTTLAGGVNTFENGTTVIFPAATTLYLDGTVWRNV